MHLLSLKYRLLEIRQGSAAPLRGNSQNIAVNQTIGGVEQEVGEKLFQFNKEVLNYE